jgi:ATP/maltotriose-dependent transcriptional regulator MalT
VELESKYDLSSGEGTTILAWLGALPEGAKRQHPMLLLDHALVLAFTGQPDAAEPLLDEAERLAEAATADRRHLLGFAAAIRCYTARLRGDVEQAVALGKRALSLLPGREISSPRLCRQQTRRGAPDQRRVRGRG